MRATPAASPPSPCEADDATTDYGNGRADSAPAHIAHQCLHMIRHNAGAPAAQGNSGAAMPIVVYQELGSEPAGNGLIFELQTDATLAMRPNTDNKRGSRTQKRKIRVRQYLPQAQSWSGCAGRCPERNCRDVQQTTRCGESFSMLRLVTCIIGSVLRTCRLVSRELTQAKGRRP